MQNKEYKAMAGDIANNLAKTKMRTMLIILAVITVVATFIAMYVFTLRFTLYSSMFRWYLVLICLLWSLPLLAYYSKSWVKQGYGARFSVAFKSVPFGSLIPLALAVALILFFMIISVASAQIFNATAYRNLINVVEYEESAFVEDIVNHDEMLIPIVDKDLATTLGDKLLGEKNLGSQFEVLNYSLSYYDGDIYWIGVIEYTGFFKWMDNKNTGSPGYIRVSATKASYETLLIEYPMQYVSSAYFSQDRDRAVYFSGANSTRLTQGRVSAELNDDGELMFVSSVVKNEFFYSGGQNTQGTIIFDPVTGESEYYDVGAEPAWVDRVHATETVIDQLDYWGAYKYGYWNTVFAKKEVVATSSGYAYIVNQDADGNTNIYLYTGMTSVGSDESIVGMALVNLKTKESMLYSTSGATEEAAMSSAEGVVQDLGYSAAWPILVNYEGVPTYIVMLKDDAGLVKSYAYVNLKDYSKVGQGETMALAQEAYETKIGLDAEEEDEELDVELTIADAQQVMDGGNTYFMIKFEESEYSDIYKMLYSVNSELLFIEDLKGLKVDVIIAGKNITYLDIVTE